jgi:hypothetical protein
MRLAERWRQVSSQVSPDTPASTDTAGSATDQEVFVFESDGRADGNEGSGVRIGTDEGGGNFPGGNSPGGNSPYGSSPGHGAFRCKDKRSTASKIPTGWPETRRPLSCSSRPERAAVKGPTQPPDPNKSFRRRGVIFGMRPVAAGNRLACCNIMRKILTHPA